MSHNETPWLLYIVILVAAFLLFKLLRYLSRRRYLVAKYGRDIGLRILSRSVWQGMSSEQLEDSWGRPADIDHAVYKTKTKETWKYNQTGKNRFKDRILCEIRGYGFSTCR